MKRLGVVGAYYQTITSFNPQIIPKNSEPLIKLFEELGFERSHTKENIGEKDVTCICMC